MTEVEYAFLDALRHADPSGLYGTENGYVAIDCFLAPGALFQALEAARSQAVNA